MAFALAPVTRRLLFDERQVLVVHDALFAGKRNEALAPGAPDQRQSDLSRQIDAPGGEARTRDQDRNAHPHRLDHHFGGQPSGGVEDLVGGIDIVAEQLGVNKDQVSRETSFVNDLGADSLDTVELVMELEEEFDINIPDDAAEKIQTVGQAIDFIEQSQANANK